MPTKTTYKITGFTGEIKEINITNDGFNIYCLESFLEDNEKFCNASMNSLFFGNSYFEYKDNLFNKTHYAIFAETEDVIEYMIYRIQKYLYQ